MGQAKKQRAKENKARKEALKKTDDMEEWFKRNEECKDINKLPHFVYDKRLRTFILQ